MTKKKNKKKPVPLVQAGSGRGGGKGGTTMSSSSPPPALLHSSRKRARQITTQFHALTRQLESAKKKRLRQQRSQVEDSDEIRIRQIEQQIEQMGGRKQYQRASQISTSYFSTSKWVLGYLAQNGWLYGIPTTKGEGPRNVRDDEETAEGNNGGDGSREKGGNRTNHGRRGRRRCRSRERRPTRILEVGAINTELLDAATRPAANTTATSSTSTATDFTTTTTPTATPSSSSSPNNVNDDDAVIHNTTNTTNNSTNTTTNNDNNMKYKYRIQVRAIDLHSMYEDRIEEADFLRIPVAPDADDRYDVIVCSMVLNCVPTPNDRGEMVCRLYHFLRPGGICFVTIPKSCLTLSPYTDKMTFEACLRYVGFHLLETKKESPKISFFICQKPSSSSGSNTIDTTSRTSVPPHLHHQTQHLNDETRTNGKDNEDGQEEEAATTTDASASSTPSRTLVPRILYRGKKYRNDFAVVLTNESLSGQNLTFT